MSIDIVLYNWHKINVFVIGFNLIIHFIYVYPIFCKHIASTEIISTILIYLEKQIINMNITS